MKTTLVILLICLLVGGQCGYQYYFASDTDTLNPVKLTKGVAGKIEAMTNMLGAASVAGGLLLAFLIYRLTFGRRFFANKSTGICLLVSVVPALLFFASFFYKSPFKLLLMIGDWCGKSKAMIALGGAAFIIGILIHAMLAFAIKAAEPRELPEPEPES